MNKKAITIATPLFFILGIFTIITGLLLAPALKEVSDEQRADLNCHWTNLTLGGSSTCIVVDIIVPYFTSVVIIGVGMGFIWTGIRG